MAREVLAEHDPAPDDETSGRAPYQVAVNRCAACGTTTMDAGGETLEVETPVAEMVDCDAQYLPAVTCETCERPRAGATAAGRATQTIPPATRRAVLRRDSKRCRVPGCRNHRFVDLHHLRARADGGGHELENLITLCGAHHRLVHRGELVITAEEEGSTIAFSHPDGSPYGVGPAPPWVTGAVDDKKRATSALHRMGFSRREAERRVRAAGAGRQSPWPDLSDLIRAALQID